MPRGRTPKTYPPEMVEHVRRLYDDGHTQKEIAIALCEKQIQATQKVVWNLMRRHRIGARVAAKRDQRGAKNSSWNGATATYSAFHHRVEVARGKPQKCEACGTTKRGAHYDWANLNGRYDDIWDYKRMCRSCHWKYDERGAKLNELLQQRKGDAR